MKPVLFPQPYLSRCFAESYAEARDKFSKQCRATAAVNGYEELKYEATGPSGELLLTAVAWQGDQSASKVLVLQSATHGVEGFAGSAIQIDTMQTLAQQDLPSDVAILYIHALNPYGFAWLRRVNEDGVDLNRNAIDFSQPLPHNLEYALLAESILPLQPADWEQADQILKDFRNEYGQQALELAISGGQYQFADGLFYGGSQPTQSRQYLHQIIERYQLTERAQVAVIDIHSGLGPFGYGEVICDHAPGTPGVLHARQWYGESVTEPALGSSSSVPKLGLIDYLWQDLLKQRVCFVTLEFGTYDIERMFEVLRQDHFLHRQPLDWNAQTTQSVKRDIRQIFYPESADWQEMVLMRGRQCVHQALNGLSEINE